MTKEQNNEDGYLAVEFNLQQLATMLRLPEGYSIHWAYPGSVANYGRSVYFIIRSPHLPKLKENADMPRGYAAIASIAEPVTMPDGTTFTKHTYQIESITLDGKRVF